MARSPPARSLIDNFGNVFTLQKGTELSFLAARRVLRRDRMLDVEAAQAEHHRAWQDYVEAHDGWFTQQANNIREVESQMLSEDYRVDHPGRVTFRTVDFGARYQVGCMAARVSDGSPVSPRTQPSERQRSLSELVRERLLDSVRV